MASNPRKSNGSRWRDLRRHVLATQSTCHLCGEEVDKTLPHLDPGAPEIDHIVPVSMGGAMWSRENAALAHRQCNQRRGNKAVSPLYHGAQDGQAATSFAGKYSPEWNARHFPLAREW